MFIKNLAKIAMFAGTIKKDELNFESTNFNPRKAIYFAFVCFLLYALFITSHKLVKTTKMLRLERAQHAVLLQEAESKNKTSGSSDSGNGLKVEPSVIYPDVTLNYSGCRGEECSFSNQYGIFGEQP